MLFTNGTSSIEIKNFDDFHRTGDGRWHYSDQGDVSTYSRGVFKGSGIQFYSSIWRDAVRYHPDGFASMTTSGLVLSFDLCDTKTISSLIRGDTEAKLALDDGYLSCEGDGLYVFHNKENTIEAKFTIDPIRLHKLLTSFTRGEKKGYHIAY